MSIAKRHQWALALTITGAMLLCLPSLQRWYASSSPNSASTNTVDAPHLNARLTVSRGQGSTSTASAKTRPIESLRVGERVLARNPEVAESERAKWVEPDWNEWLHLSLSMPKDDGTTLEIELIRPETWVRSQMGLIADDAEPSQPTSENSADAVGPVFGFESAAAAVFQSANLSPLRPIFRDLAQLSAGLDNSVALRAMLVELDLPELAITGSAIVRDITNLSTVNSGEGKVVTATFKHSSGNVLDLVVADSGADVHQQKWTIGTTSNHPFWSVDRQEFVQAGSLELNERLQTYSGDTKRVLAKLPRPGPKPVYNIEVFGEHVYYVGQDGLLVHNAYDSTHVYAAFRKDSRGNITSVAYVGMGTSSRAASIEKRVADALFGGNIAKANQHFEFRKVELKNEFQARGMEQRLIDTFGGANYSRAGSGWEAAWQSAEKSKDTGLWNVVNSFDWYRTTGTDRLAKFQKSYNNDTLFNQVLKDLGFIEHGLIK
jgi:Pretoxin HINT domain